MAGEQETSIDEGIATARATPTRKGSFLIKRKTWPDRMRAKLKAVSQELQRRMHCASCAVGKWLGYVVFMRMGGVTCHDKGDRIQGGTRFIH
jgi:hypothetical protein